MTAKWTAKTIPEGKSSSGAMGALENEFVVLLLYGKNSFGDKIYSFVKINLPNLPKLKTAILAGKGFTPSDFGSVVAAGKGEPTDAVRAEVAAAYPVMMGGTKPLHPVQAAVSSSAPQEKKGWDEY